MPRAPHTKFQARFASAHANCSMQIALHGYGAGAQCQQSLPLLLLRLAESTSVSPRARENARLEVGIRVAHQRTRNQAIQEITGYIGIFSLTSNGNRHAPVTCKPLLTRSDTMQSNLLLDPLNSTVANRPHFFSTFGLKVGP